MDDEDEDLLEAYERLNSGDDVVLVDSGMSVSKPRSLPLWMQQPNKNMNGQGRKRRDGVVVEPSMENALLMLGNACRVCGVAMDGSTRVCQGITAGGGLGVCGLIDWRGDMDSMWHCG